MDSILNATKKFLGISEEDNNFDQDIIMHINSVLAILTQMGVGPSEGFAIEGAGETWDNFIPDGGPKYSGVKSYVYLKVRLLFDPPSSSTHMEAIKQAISEFEWRLNVTAESK